MALAVPASLAGASVEAQVTATGCVGCPVELGTAGAPAPTVALHAYTPSGGSVTVGPIGAWSKAFLRAFRLGLTPQTQVEVLTLALQNLMITTAARVIPAPPQATYAATDFSAEQSPLLSDLLDSSGNPVPVFSELQAQAP